MATTFFRPFLGVILLLACCLLPGRSDAVTRYVVTSLSSCPTTTADSCFTSVSDAITKAVSGDLIEIRPGSYQGNFSVAGKNISLYGTETARCILDGGGSGTVLTLNNVTGTSVRTLTIANAVTGIAVAGSTGIDIRNNIIEDTTTGIQTNSAPLTIANNTFSQNANGINAGTIVDTITIGNNIFYLPGGATALSPPGSNLNLITNNLFFGGAVGPAVVLDSTSLSWLGNIGTGSSFDPLFVNPDTADRTLRDFHLRASSPAINTGNTAFGTNRAGDATKADIGAYGGPFSDTIPARIADLASVVSGTSVTLTWSPNLCYLVAGYNIYTGSASGAYSATADAGLVTTYTITSSSVITAPTGSPMLSYSLGSSSLVLVWDTTPVSGATGYEVRYDTVSPPTIAIDVGATMTYALGGLQNGTTYHVAVVPYAVDRRYMAVKAYYTGKTQMSDFSNEVVQDMGGKLYGPSSNEIQDFPEALMVYPELPNSGCFIATAAYGSYLSPQVRTLRLFRDRYLMTNRAGRTVVAWYYRQGPVAARFIEDHAWLKPFVRVCLLPVVAFAFVLVSAPPLAAVAGVLLPSALYAAVRRKRKRAAMGGLR